MSRTTDTLLVHVRLDEELLERIDTFRFENRFEDRTRAIRWLLKWALNNSGKTRPGSSGADPSGLLRAKSPTVSTFPGPSG